MHRSRLSTFVIDCRTADIQRAAEFWGAAMGRAVHPEPPAPEPEPLYRRLDSRPEEALGLVQKMDHESRIHLDIETHDMEGEGKRLEARGAKRVAFVRRWWVMEAPTGQRFCVVNPQRGSLEGAPGVNVWP